MVLALSVVHSSSMLKQPYELAHETCSSLLPTAHSCKFAIIGVMSHHLQSANSTMRTSTPLASSTSPATAATTGLLCFPWRHFTRTFWVSVLPVSVLVAATTAATAASNLDWVTTSSTKFGWSPFGEPLPPPLPGSRGSKFATSMSAKPKSRHSRM